MTCGIDHTGMACHTHSYFWEVSGSMRFRVGSSFAPLFVHFSDVYHAFHPHAFVRVSCLGSREYHVSPVIFLGLRYREFLLRVCAAEEEIDAGDENGTEVSLGDWSALRCRVEEGFSRVSKVLEDGTIQVNVCICFLPVVCGTRRRLESDALKREILCLPQLAPSPE